MLGAAMYPGYEQYWCAMLQTPGQALPFSGKAATQGEIDYARFADRTPHIVLSRTLKQVGWKTARIVREVDEVRTMKQQPGKDIYAVGGATLVSSLINFGLIDELRLAVHPVVLGQGKALFKDVKDRQALNLVEVKAQEGRPDRADLHHALRFSGS